MTIRSISMNRGNHDSMDSTKRKDSPLAEGRRPAHPLLIAFFIAAIGLIIALQSGILNPSPGGTLTSPPPKAGLAAATKPTRMSLSPFDASMGHEMMDKDHDGLCDTCGMPVDMCISGGQVECTMGGKHGIGEIGSGHTHADWKVYLNGKPMNWSGYEDLHERQMRSDTQINLTSALIHLHPEHGQQPGSVLHMHATGVPLWFFFKSLGMELTDECLTVSPSEQYCTTKENTLKLLVNGKRASTIRSFVFNDGDQLLLSYGPPGEDLTRQLSSITSFAKTHEAHGGGIDEAH